MEESEAHYFIRAKADGDPLVSGREGDGLGTAQGPGQGSGSGQARFGVGGHGDGYRRLEEMEVEEYGRVKPVSPAVEEFRRVSRRGSWLTRGFWR